MPAETESAIVRLSRSTYTALLYFYPRELRQEFGGEMAELFTALLCDAIADRGPVGIIPPWRSALAELFTVAVPLRLASNAVMAAAISFLASSALVLLFFRAVT
jgi:hypothetical protein